MLNCQSPDTLTKGHKMLYALKTNLLRDLYAHPECDHEALFQALVAHETPDIPDSEFYALVDNLNGITNQAWQLEVL